MSDEKPNQPQPTTHAPGEKTDKLDAEAGGTPTVSLKKVEANRRNARKSTGPRTSSGKKTVSRNAIKHGFFSKHLLVPGGSESQEEYAELHASIWRDFQPVGWREEDCVDTIAVLSWRLRRVIRCESGQIARSLAGNSFQLQQARADEAAEPDAVPMSSPQMDAMTDHLFWTSDELRTRYEAMINRQRNHAIAELERLQARRKDCPPPRKIFAEQSQESL